MTRESRQDRRFLRAQGPVAAPDITHGNERARQAQAVKSIPIAVLRAEIRRRERTFAKEQA